MCCFTFFCFKQKTAYEMRISDWSSDVCSSDLFDLPIVAVTEALRFERFLSEARENGRTPEVRDFPEWRRERIAWFGLAEAQEEAWPLPGGKIGRAHV